MEQKITLDKVVHWVGIFLIVVLVAFFVRKLSNVLLPFFVAWVLAYLLYPAVAFIQYRLHVRVRALAILITLLLALAIIGGLAYLIIPPMIDQFGKMREIIHNYIATKTEMGDFYGYIQNVLAQNKENIDRFLQSPDFSDAVKSMIPQFFAILGHTMSLLWSVIASCITILYMFFILLDYEYLAKSWVKVFPKRSRSFWRDVMTDFQNALNNYVRGQAMVAFCMGVMFCIGFTIIDFPMAIGLGILIGILDLVPYLHTIALLPTAFLALMKAADTGQNFWLIFGMAVAVFCIVQVITDMVVTPRIMSKAMGLNPAILLLSLSIWGALLGFIGLIIALPMTTLLFAYWQRYVTKENE